MATWLKHRLGQLLLKLSRWQGEGEKPALRKYVLIAAPHTSNWDLIYMLALSFVYDVKISWLAKHTLFRPPLGWLLRRLGGMPVDRRTRHGLVAEAAQSFDASDSLVLMVAPEGTRRRSEYWRSGFYHIARAAGVPIVLGFLDYRRRTGGFGPAIETTGNPRTDMDVIRAFYRDKTGRRPQMQGSMRLREEEESQRSLEEPDSSTEREGSTGPGAATAAAGSGTEE